MALCLVMCQQRHDGRNCNYEDTQSKVQHTLRRSTIHGWLTAKCLKYSWRCFLQHVFHRCMRISQGFPPSQLNSVRQGLIANAMAHKAPNMASRVTTNVQCAFIITMNDPQSCSLTGSNTKWDVVGSHWLNTKSFARLAAWLLSGHTVFVKPQPPNRKNATHLQIDGWVVFPGTLRRPKKRPILRTLEQIYEQCSCPANEVLWEGK